MTRLMKNGLARTGLLLAISHFMLSGCAMMYKGMGDTMIAYSEDQLIPYLLSTDDDVMGCASGESLTPLLLSFGNVTTPPDHIAVLVYMVAGLCEEEHALEQELRYLRAVKQQNVLEAQDARIAQKRHHALAAKRQYAGYQALQRYLGDPGQHCPHFKNDEEELIWLLGNTVGVLAVFNDGQTNGHVGIPKNIAAKAERAAACLDNDVWWGMPMAMRATLWAVVPGLQPDGEDPWQRLQESARIADQSGVRLVYVFDAIAALTAGKTARVKHAIM